MQFLFCPLVGNLSDYYGRKPILLTSLLVVGAEYIILGVSYSIWVLLGARLIAGIAAATHATALASMADVSKPDEKAQNFALVGAAFGIGFILGPLMGSFLSEFGTRVPFFGAAILAGGNFIFGYFMFRETLDKEHRRSFSWQRANPISAFKSVGKFPLASVVLVIYLIHQLAFFVYPSVWSYYTIEKFNWSPWLIGISLSAYGVGVVITQGWLIRYIMPKLGEWNTVVLGMVFVSIAGFAYAFAPNGLTIFLIIPFASLGFLVTPSLQAIISNAAPDDVQGEVQGVICKCQRNCNHYWPNRNDDAVLVFYP